MDDSFIKLTRIDGECLFIRKSEICAVTPGCDDCTSIWMPGSGDSYYYVKETVWEVLRLLGAIKEVRE